MKKLAIATLLCLSLGTVECRKPRVQEETIEVTPWYLQYKMGALIGAVANGLYEGLSFDINDPEIQAMDPKTIEALEAMGSTGIGCVGAFQGTIRGLLAVAAARGIFYLAGKETTIEVKTAL